MKANAVILIFLILAIGTPAKAQKGDSLKREMVVAHGEKQKGLLALQLGKWYLGIQPDSSIMYFNHALAIAKKTGLDSVGMEAEGGLGFANRDVYKLDSAKIHLGNAINMARAIHCDTRLTSFLVEQGETLASLFEYEPALEACQQALRIVKLLGQREREAEIYFAMGGIYMQLSNYAVAVDVLEQSIKINDSLKLPKKLAADYFRVGTVFAKQKKYKESLRYFFVADSVFTYLKLDKNAALVGINMAIAYKNIGEYDKAIALYQRGLKSFEDVPMSRMVIYINMGITLTAKGNFKQAHGYFFSAAALNNSSFHIKDIDFNIYKEMANAFFKEHNYDSALYYARKSEQIDKQVYNEQKHHMEEYSDCVSLLARIYTAKNDAQTAGLYYKQFADLQDSAIAHLQLGKQADADAKLNLGEKNRQLTALLNENELQRLKVQRQRTQGIALVVGLCMGGVVILTIIVAYRRSIKKNTILKEQQKVLSEQKVTIDAQVVQLAQAAELKSKFLANVSHELRTPATVLSGMLELMKENGTVKKEDRPKLDVAYRNSRKLQVMVEEILDLSKLDNKAASIKLEIRDAEPLLDRIALSFEGLVEKENLTFVNTLRLAKHTYLDIDEDMFERIINNLIYNAIKFNKPGGTIKMGAVPVENGDSLKIEISDSGIGIGKQDLPYIFERFYQGASNNNVQSKGVGIGLSLVMEFTALLGGTVSVASEEGSGTVFTLYFPIAKNVAAPSIVESEPQTLPVIDWARFRQKPEVLIVEDNADMRYYLKEVLGGLVNISEAEHGQAALEWLEHHKPDMIITDMMMPVMDGGKFVARLKAIDTHKNTPIIMLTAMADTDNRQQLLRMGIDDYIVKPFNPNELKVRLYNILNNAIEREVYVSAEPEAVMASNAETEEFMDKLRKIILAKIGNIELSVADVAEELGYSERKFYRFAKSLTGYTPAQLIKEIRLIKAYDLLVAGEVYKLDDLAKRVGYDHTSYFSRQFLERFGKSPADFL